MQSMVDSQNTDCTLYVGELDPLVTEALLWELMIQAGPVGKINAFAALALLTLQ